MNKRILHIANGYWARKVYHDMILAISKFSVSQTVFVPIRDIKDAKNYDIIRENVKIIYSLVVSSIFYRVFFNLKIKKTISKIDNEIDVKDFDIIHAHTLFSDGAVALHYYKKYKIPYIIAIRNVDVNEFFKFLIYLRPLGREILNNAHKIVFLSYSYRQRLISNYVLPKDTKSIEEKSIVIPNGINHFWFDNKNTIRNKKDNKFTLVYAGEFVRNKNLLNVIKAVNILSKQGIDVHYNIVGEGHNDSAAYLKLLKQAANGNNNVSIIKARDKQGMLEEYRNADIFVMASYTESFGLVYAEAISQGLPVIYTKGEGFDNHFEDGKIGFSVNPHSPEDIARGISSIIDNYNDIQKYSETAIGNFNWDKISKDYFELYSNMSI